MNPEKMRGTYGKLVYLLQDAMSEAVARELEFKLVVPIKSVYDELTRLKAVEVLSSEWISTATMEILPENKSRSQIQREIKYVF